MLYIISYDWIYKWINYLLYEGSEYPGPINNSAIIYEMSMQQPTILGKTVIIITKQIWEYLNEKYKGGPCLKWPFLREAPV